MLKTIYNSGNYYIDTDKQTAHSYIDHLYTHLFDHRYKSAKKILEIGVYRGGSVALWRDYFINADIYCIDINKINFPNEERIIFKLGNAYSHSIKDTLPDDFDIIIDDGPHTLDSMIYCIEYYTYKINNNGILIIEDIQDERWVPILQSRLNNDLFQSRVYDLRHIKNRYDDLVLVVERR